MLRKGTITLFFLLFLTIGNIVYAQEDRIIFTDLDEGYWAEKQIYELTSLKVINGYPDHTFRPDEKVTRAEFAAMVSRAMKLANADSNFKDVPKTSALYKEVSQAAAAGIVVGDGKGSFHPDRHVSRAEMAIMIDRALQLKGKFTVTVDLSYDDKSEIGISSLESIQRLTNYQVMEALVENSFHPNEKGTRVETTVAVYQMLKAIEYQHETVGISHIYAGKVNANPSLRVRENPTTDSEILGRLSTGTIVHIVAEENGWFQISYNGKHGFISKDFVTILTSVEKVPNTDKQEPKQEDLNEKGQDENKEQEVDENTSETPGNQDSEENNDTSSEDLDEEKNKQSDQDTKKDDDTSDNNKEPEKTLKQSQYLKGEITASKLNVRAKPSTSSDRIGELLVGTVVNILSTEGDWHEILFKGKSAFVHKDFVKIIEAKEINLLANRTIVIDPGHGGRDPGAVVNGMRESDIVLKVSLLLQELLEAEGVNVIMTRTDDTFPTLAERSEISNSHPEVDLFLSVHANSATNTAANGVETYWNSQNSSDLSYLFAIKLQDQLINHMDFTNRGVKHANFQVVRNTKAPSTLVELGFMSNEKDLSYMKTDKYYRDAADGLFHGIVDYFNSIEQLKEN